MNPLSINPGSAPVFVLNASEFTLYIHSIYQSLQKMMSFASAFRGSLAIYWLITYRLKTENQTIMSVIMTIIPSGYSWNVGSLVSRFISSSDPKAHV